MVGVEPDNVRIPEDGFTRPTVARCVHCGGLFDCGEDYLAHIPCVAES
jgi:hypothetical protein